jgi:CubicO group peptidase (beta-lactamase class C family)
MLICLFGAVLLAAPPKGDPQKAGMDPERLSRIAKRMKEFVEEGKIAGAVTLVARRGVVVHHEAVGWQNIEKKLPMKPDTIFQIMSMTKPMTAVAIMMLADEGRVALVDPVEKHLPEFRGQKVIVSKTDEEIVLRKPARPITVRDLLMHTSGMPTMPPPGFGELYFQLDRTLAEAVIAYSQTPLEFEPGTRWLYSNPGIATLGRIVEVVSGMPFETFLQARIFDPLGMKDTFLFPPDDKKSRIAMVYQLRDGKLEPAGDRVLGGAPGRYREGAKYSGPEFAAYSTATDLAAFYEMVRTGGVHNGKRLLSKAAVDLMTSLQTGDLKAGHMPGTGFGLAWEVVKEPLGESNYLSAGTAGHGGAFGTHGWIDKQKELVGVYLVQGGPVDGKYAFMRLAGAAVVD